MFNDIWPFGPSPRPQGAGTKKMVLLHVAFMQVTHTPNLVEFREKKLFWPPNPPTVLPSPTCGAWPRRPNENPVWYVLYLSFLRRHTKFGLKIFEIYFVIEI